MEIKKPSNKLKRFWEFLKKDTWQSWFVSIVLLFILIKLILFPLVSFLTGSPLPLVVVESCSMYHESPFEEWFSKNSAFYEERNITYSDFKSFSNKNGLNKGDIILVVKKAEYNMGDIIIFDARARYPIIHRVISQNPLGTKGDHNSEQITIEKEISEGSVLGKAQVRIPFIGWLKLIFFDFAKPAEQRGLCR